MSFGFATPTPTVLVLHERKTARNGLVVDKLSVINLITQKGDKQFVCNCKEHVFRFHVKGVVLRGHTNKHIIINVKNLDRFLYKLYGNVTWSHTQGRTQAKARPFCS